jgi:hypothetical protein
MSKSSLSVTAAVAVAVLGAFPLLSILGAPAEEPMGADPDVAVAPPAPVSPPPTAAPEIITMTEPTPEVAEVSDSIVRLLHARGYIQNEAGSALEIELPETVVKVLIDRGVVLAVATEEGTGGGEVP